jgi:hypothetical protein
MEPDSFFRLLIGAGVAAQGMLQQHALWGIAGFVLIMGALFNCGCCGSAACSFLFTQKQQNNHAAGKEVDTLQ